jgi:hypothetical protein
MQATNMQRPFRFEKKSLSIISYHWGDADPARQ